MTVAAVFAVMLVARLARNGGRFDPAARTWTVIVLIFAAVGAWLLSGGSARL